MSGVLNALTLNRIYLCIGNKEGERYEYQCKLFDTYNDAYMYYKKIKVGDDYTEPYIDKNTMSTTIPICNLIPKSRFIDSLILNRELNKKYNKQTLYIFE